MRALIAPFATAALAAVCLSGTAQAVTLIDGSFEAGSFGGSIIRVGAARQVLPAGGGSGPGGWMEYGGAIGNIGRSIWAASDGQRSLDLGALGDGGIVQRISGFTAGRSYRLRFDLSGNPFDTAARPRDKRVLVSASGETPGLFTYTLTSANTPENMRYQRYFYDFTAISETQNIRFASLSPGSFGAVLDNVTLSVVPEAATWGLLLTGFGAIGVMARRRREQTVSVTA